jgi:hypothetical protein
MSFMHLQGTCKAQGGGSMTGVVWTACRRLPPPPERQADNPSSGEDGEGGGGGGGGGGGAMTGALRGRIAELEAENEALRSRLTKALVDGGMGQEAAKRLAELEQQARQARESEVGMALGT